MSLARRAAPWFDRDSARSLPARWHPIWPGARPRKALAVGRLLTHNLFTFQETLPFIHRQSEHGSERTGPVPAWGGTGEEFDERSPCRVEGV